MLITCPAILASFEAVDTPSDGGSSVSLRWAQPFSGAVQGEAYVDIERRTVGEPAWTKLATLSLGDGEYVDQGTQDGVLYEYRIRPSGAEFDMGVTAGPVSSSAQWYSARRTPVAVAVLVCFAVIALVAWISKKAGEFYVRPIRGLQAVDEAVGRATEMGKPVLFTPGWGGDIQRPTTIASLNVLSYVARKTASYKCDIYFPTHDPVIMTAAEEVIREAYIEEGQADNYDADNVFYTTSSQLGYAAAVDGIITRYEPAAIFLLGTFEGEALILAETGNSIGAMQVAGTDSTIQLSFFMVACDYTLIGEELFAASGYLTKDAKILSSVKVQDYLKLIIAILLIIGVVLASAGNTELADWIGRS